MRQDNMQRDMTLIFLAALLFFCIGLGARPYLTPSEARYIEVPRQMLITHDWLTPRINGVPYFEKPPLFYWMQASVMQFFGLGEFAGRIATAIMTALLCTLTFATGRMLYGRRAGLLSALVLATCAMGYGLSRVAMVDMPVSLFMTACLAGFLAAQHSDGRLKQRFYLLMYAASSLAVLAKGLIGIVIPGLIIGAWIIAANRWRILREARLISGLILFLVIAAPWHWLMMRAHPDFFQFYFIHEHFQRFLTDEAKRVEPWWFFIAITLAGFLPWTGLLYPAARRLRWKAPDEKFLMLWIVLPLLFFSASHSKLAAYILPIFPPLAMIIGRSLADMWEQPAPPALKRNSLFVAFLFALLLAAYGVLHYWVPLPHAEDVKLAIGRDIAPWMLLPLALAVLGLLYSALQNGPSRILVGALAGFGAVVGLSANFIVGKVDHASTKPLAALLETQLKPEDTVAIYGSYFQDLPVYLNHNVTVVGYTGELEFGVTHYPATHDWMISDDTFWRRCGESRHAVYVFMKNTTFDSLKMPANCRLHPLASYGRNVLLEKKQ